MSANVDVKTIVVLEGDDTGQELLEEALRVLAPAVIGFALALGEIHTSFQAGGITSARMRSSLSSSVIAFPRAST